MLNLSIDRRSTVTPWLVAALTLVSALPPASAAAQAFEEKPLPDTAPTSFVVVMVDDLGVASFRQLLDAGKLPRIEEHLIDAGTDFPQAFVSNSLCCPSRATFLTGQYAHNHGVQNVAGTNGGYSAFHPGGQDRPHLGAWLQSAGYFTALIGKYKNGYGAGLAAPSGWNHWRALPSHNLVPGSYRFVRADGTTVTPTTYQTRAVGDEAIATLATVPASQPFFFFLAPTAPHVENLSDWNNDGCNSTTHPNFTGFLSPDRGDFDLDGTIDGYSAKAYAEYGCANFADGCLRQANGSPLPGFDLPGQNKASFDSFAATPQVVRERWESLACADNLAQLRRLHSERLESMLSIDIMVGQVVDALADAGRLDDTVIVFTSDNGYFLGEHRLGNKGLAYDESVRVPLVIRPVERVAEAIHLLVANVDLAPTLLDYADLDWDDPLYAVDGRSLVHHLEPSYLVWEPWRNSLLLEAEHPRGLNLAGPQSWWMFPDYHALRTSPLTEAFLSDLTYVVYDDPIWPGGYAEEFLFDQKTDPDQVIDRVDDPIYAGHLPGLRALLDALADCAGDTCRSLEENFLLIQGKAAGSPNPRP